MQKQKKWLIGICSTIIFCAIVGISYIIFLSNSTYSLLDNHVRVEEDSELTYYLDILYDGKDKNVVMSSDEAIADVRSDYIYIEDKIPDGLTFIGFVNSADGSIGAVKRSDGVTKCGGYVIDGVNGLSYNEETRTVSFKIKNLQAGCKLTVGIITKTPFLGDKIRMDFYNTAFGREKSAITKSNTVHVYLGRDTETLYNVTYQYTGDIPENAPTLPEASEYAEGTTVGLISNITVPGYTFSGWQTANATINNSSFVMPATNVVIQGSFTKNQTYTVSYELEGTNQPDNYILPKTKSYGAGEEITVDSLKAGDVIGSYKFLGWTSTDITLGEDGVFEMPTKNVVIKGSFEPVKYSVTYQFQGNVLPPNADSLLPPVASYLPGETVTVAENPVIDGYRFLGWYRTETFEMPEEDVVISGEWMVSLGYFSPTITKTIVEQAGIGPDYYYSKGEKLLFNITVTNTATFGLHDVMIQEETEGSKFISGEGYTVLNDRHVRIDSIPAGGSVVMQAEYTVGDNAYAEITNTVVLSGALADENYYLDTTKEYKATASFKISNISLEIIKKDPKDIILEGATFGLYEDEACTNKISEGMIFKRLIPGKTYYLKETKAPTGYILLKDALPVTADESGVINIPNYTVEGTNGINSVVIFNQKINILPNTGGIGTVPFIIGGLFLMVGASAGYVYFAKRKRKDYKE